MGEKIAIYIDNKKYIINCYLDWNYLNYYFKEVDKKKSYLNSFKEMSFLLFKNNNSEIDKEKFFSISDSELIKILNGIVNENFDLQSEFQILENNNVFEKFYIAANKVYIDLEDVSRELIRAINDTVVKPNERLLKTYKKIFENNINKRLNYIRESIRSQFENIKKQLPDKADMLCLFEKREANAMIWAKYGWVTILTASIRYLDYAPENKEEADIMGEQCININNIDFDIFNKYTLDNLNFNDLREAFKCYNRANYKACVMLLMALIERIWSDFYSKYYNHKISEGEREIGSRALKEIKKYKETDLKKMMYSKIIWMSLLEVLSGIFRYADGFKAEPDILNRNFLMHGFTHKKITKIDCIKLILIVDLIFDEDNKREKKQSL